MRVRKPRRAWPHAGRGRLAFASVHVAAVTHTEVLSPAVQRVVVAEADSPDVELRYHLNTSMPDVTQILQAIESGDAKAAGELLPLVYQELRKLAAHRMSAESPDHTLQPTALVHEAYLRLVGKNDPGWQNRGHFFAAAAEAMRRILVDAARRKGRVKHGHGQRRQEFNSDLFVATEPNDELLAVDAAVTKLATHDPQKARLVELRFFAGLTGAQAAEVLGISPSSADRHWVFARAWLRRELGVGQRPEEI